MLFWIIHPFELRTFQKNRDCCHTPRWFLFEIFLHLSSYFFSSLKQIFNFYCHMKTKYFEKSSNRNDVHTIKSKFVKIISKKIGNAVAKLNSIWGPPNFRKVHFLSVEKKIRRWLAVEQRRQLWVQLTSYWQSEPTDIGLENFRALPRVEGLTSFVSGRWLP